MKGAELPDISQILQADRLAKMGLDIVQSSAPHMRRQPAADRPGTHAAITGINEEIDDRLRHRLFGQQMTARQHRFRHLPKPQRQSGGIGEGHFGKSHEPRIAVEGLGKHPAHLIVRNIQMDEFEEVGDFPFGRVPLRHDAQHTRTTARAGAAIQPTRSGAAAEIKTERMTVRPLIAHPVMRIAPDGSRSPETQIDRL
jgi:hypothetical protein